MFRWLIFRGRESLRWLFRGSNFTKLERDVQVMSDPLSRGEGTERDLSIARSRIGVALSYLPVDRAEKYHEMMDRYGHSVRSK